jgi:hypothetical protein
MKGQAFTVSCSEPFFGTTIGKKLVVAVTGLIVYVYVLGHLAGNLLIYGGRDVINNYAHLLHALRVPICEGFRFMPPSWFLQFWTDQACRG